jgi:hypothetical protein
VGTAYVLRIRSLLDLIQRCSTDDFFDIGLTDKVETTGVSAFDDRHRGSCWEKMSVFGVWSVLIFHLQIPRPENHAGALAHVTERP